VAKTASGGILGDMVLASGSYISSLPQVPVMQDTGPTYELTDKSTN